MIFKDIRKKSIVVICLLIPFFCFSRQTVLDKKISIHAHNETIVTILHRIEQLAGVNFMYMSGLFNKNKLVSISFTNTSIKNILQKIIPSNDVLLYVIDNKIIFYKKDEAPPGKEGITYSLTQTESEPTTKQAESVKQIILDTLRVTVFDTVKITKYDTIRLIEKPNNVVTAIKKANNTSIILSASCGINFVTERLINNSVTSILSIIKKGEVSKQKRFEEGLNLTFQFSHFAISSGIGFENRMWNADYEYKKTFIDSSKTVGYSESTQTTITDKSISVRIMEPALPPPLNILPRRYKDTVIVIKDTSKIITRSPIYKKDSVKVNYKGLNTASYITIPLLLSFNFTINQKITALIGTGLKIHLLRKATGFTVTDTKYVLSPLSDYLRDYYLTSISEFGLQYSISKHQIVMLKTGFSFSISPIMKQQFPIKRSEQYFSAMICWGWKF